MSCSRKIHIDGLTLSVCLGVCGYKCIALNIEDHETKQAVLNKDPRALDVLALAFAEIKDIIAPLEFGGLDWEYNCDEKAFEDIARRILQSVYADAEDIEAAEDALNRLAKYRRQTIQKKAKKYYIQQRRGEFAKEQSRLMLALIDRDGYSCVICDSTERLGVDHILPLSRGGNDELDNLRLLCPACNSRKGDRVEH